MIAGRFSQYLALGSVVIFLILASPRGGGAQVGVCCPPPGGPMPVPTCLATGVMWNLNGGFYLTTGPNPPYPSIFKAVTDIYWNCPEGSNNSCWVCAETLWDTGPSKKGPWTSAGTSGSVSAQTNNAKCNTTSNGYAFTDTYGPISKSSTWYRVRLGYFEYDGTECPDAGSDLYNIYDTEYLNYSN
jgi:hypothetical protein